jgi:hypothetical protein
VARQQGASLRAGRSKEEWTPIVANATYNLNDQMTAMQSNGVRESRDYNVLGQLTGARPKKRTDPAIKLAIRLNENANGIPLIQPIAGCLITCRGCG